MPLDREKTYKSAERLLRQGKTQEALRELRQIADDAPRDLLMLNRIGDLLTRMGRNAEAIGYYQGIAEQFAEAGFLPKAVAIVKKILRLDPERVESLVRLGDFYVKQKLPSEARHHLLHAADKYLRARQFAKAREVYEKVVLTEPGEPLHRARLAEARAAEGDSERAGQDLVALGKSFLESGRLEEATRTFRRAGQIVPERFEPLSGLASCLWAEGKAAEAIRTLEEATAKSGNDPGAAGELALLYEQAGRTEDADRILAGPAAERISDDVVERMLKHHHAAGKAELGWERIDPLLARLQASEARERIGPLLERVSDIESQGHIPALQRLFELRKNEQNRPGMSWALERLVGAYRSRSMHDEASLMLDQLRQLGPAAGRAAVRESPAGAVTRASGSAPSDPGLEARPGALESDVPAVPLGPADEEYVNGHLTEAEVFEKYGLVTEALEQLRQVTGRFPGHVIAQERLAALFGSQGDRGSMQSVLVDLAFARRAVGKVAEAREAAKSAVEIGPLLPETRRRLEELSLLTVPEAPAQPAEEEADIVFDDVEEVEVVEEDAPAATARAPFVPEGRTIPVSVGPAEPSGARTPPKDVLEEISFFVSQGMVEDARRKIDALRTLGFGGAELETIAASAGKAAPVEGAVVPSLATPAHASDDADLGAMIQSLEDELAADSPTSSAVNFDQQSVGEVFEAFKRHVDAQVGDEDYRTHYDLGIAYKEMGLLDDALAEFHAAMRSPELLSDACSMLAICHRERGEVEEAVRWYREALSGRNDADPSRCGLRYDLAETLLEAGDAEGALGLFRDVLEADPSYRDVRARVRELQERLRS